MRVEEERLIVASLSAKYPIFAESTIRRWVAGESARYVGAKILTYIPMLVQRSVDATLRELARTEGTSADLLSLASAEQADRRSISV